MAALAGSERDNGSRRRVLVIAAPANADAAASAPADVAASFEQWRACYPATPPANVAHLDDDIVQMYTSGTSGRPKGVCLSHRNYFAIFRQVDYPWNRYDSDDVVFAPSPFFHVAGMNQVMRGLCGGVCLVTVPVFQPADLPRILQDERITRTTMVPAVIQLCLSTPDIESYDFSALKVIMYGASPITQDLLRRALAVFKCQFVQAYGMTEATAALTMLHPDDHDPALGKLRSCGRPVREVEVRVVAADGKPCEPGAVGEIIARGPNITRGYWRDPDATARTIVDGWLHTGDAGYFDTDGYLYIHDRIKDMIVSGGENVYPAEVEDALADHPAVADVAVIGVPDAKWGEAVKALVVLRANAETTAPELIAFARTRIAGYKVPKSIDFVGILPRNAAGKILRRDLRAPYWEGRERLVN
jgi:acyl-CoA synthetase (AMP-forming)/AMP-acid ligase II